MLALCRDYNIALRIELKRREIKDDPSRAAELAAYFTHCNLQRLHMILALRSAMSIFFKLKNYNTCSTFCRRILELQPDEKVGGGCRCRDYRAEAGRCVGRRGVLRFTASSPGLIVGCMWAGD